MHRGEGIGAAARALLCAGGGGGGRPLRLMSPSPPCLYPSLHLCVAPPWCPLLLPPLHTRGRGGAGEAPPLGGLRAVGLAACGAGVHVGTGGGVGTGARAGAAAGGGAEGRKHAARGMRMPRLHRGPCGWGRGAEGERRGRLYQPSSVGIADPFAESWRPVPGGRGLPWGWCLVLERAYTRPC